MYLQRESALHGTSTPVCALASWIYIYSSNKYVKFGCVKIIFSEIYVQF